MSKVLLEVSGVERDRGNTQSVVLMGYKAERYAEQEVALGIRIQELTRPQAGKDEEVSSQNVPKPKCPK